MNTRKENLFASDKWSNPQCKDELIDNVRKFLVRHLK